MRTMSPLALVVGLCLVLAAGCLPSDRGFGVVIPGEGLQKALAVSLNDKAGILDGIALGEPTGGTEPAISSLPDHQDVLVVTWIGGECDHRVNFVLDDDGGSYVLTGTAERDAGCTLVGIIRTIQVDLSKDVDPSLIRFTSEGL